METLAENQQIWRETFKALTPRSDNYVISLYNIHTSSNKQVMGILNLIRKQLLH